MSPADPDAQARAGRYDQVIGDLARAYDAAVAQRSVAVLAPWKLAEEQAFLARVQQEGGRSLLEIGAGTGRHGRFFADAGLEVVCTDLSAAMVDHCRAIGLDAHQRDFLHLDLGRRFDAVFAMNCLLHVPREDLPAVLASVRSVLRGDGLFYLGQYGGVDEDGIFEDDTYEPKRYFSRLRDVDLLAFVVEHFTVESFTAVDIGATDGTHFQSVVLRA